MDPETGKKLPVFCPNDALLKILQCPVCLEIPQQHIWNCTNGHFICASCRTKINNKCVLCREKYTTSRNFPLEAIIITCKFTCGFEKYGCEEAVSGDSIRHHRDNCYYRPMICYLGKADSCNFTIVNYKNYFQHLTSVHNIFRANDYNYLKIRQKSALNSKEDYQHWISMSIKFHDQIFLVRSFKLASDIYWSVGIIANDIEAAKYIANITLTSSDRSGGKVEGKAHVIQTAVQSVRLFRYKFQPNHPHGKLEADELKNMAIVKADEKEKNIWKIQWQTEYSLRLKTSP